MKKQRNKNIDRQCMAYLTVEGNDSKLVEHCLIQSNRPNTNGTSQHISINPKRQLKKLIQRMLREKLIQLS